MRVLVIEDEVKLASLIHRALREAGLIVDVAIKGEDALWMAGSSEYDVIVLDVMLPGIDGFETCSRLRSDGIRAPILMLTARGEIADRVTGLNTGADDYLTKPFAFDELLARIHALGRRGGVALASVLELGDLRVDPVAHRAWRGAAEIDLSAREFLVLEALIRHPGATLTRHQLLERAWDTEYDTKSNVVDVYIGYLREKVDRPFGRASIETVRGVGYRLVDESATAT